MVLSSLHQIFPKKNIHNFYRNLYLLLIANLCFYLINLNESYFFFFFKPIVFF